MVEGMLPADVETRHSFQCEVARLPRVVRTVSVESPHRTGGSAYESDG